MSRHFVRPLAPRLHRDWFADCLSEMRWQFRPQGALEEAAVARFVTAWFHQQRELWMAEEFDWADILPPDYREQQEYHNNASDRWHPLARKAVRDLMELQTNRAIANFDVEPPPFINLRVYERARRQSRLSK